MVLQLQADFEDVERRDAESGYEACYSSGYNDLRAGALWCILARVDGFKDAVVVSIPHRGEALQQKTSI